MQILCGGSPIALQEKSGGICPVAAVLTHRRLEPRVPDRSCGCEAAVHTFRHFDKSMLQNLVMANLIFPTTLLAFKDSIFNCSHAIIHSRAVKSLPLVLQ
jgi:hypothetical protein